MAEPLQSGIARLRGMAGQPVVGTGFLIAKRHIMTCAHVINDALDRSWDDPSHPERTLRVEFPFARRSTALEARVVEWRPPSDGIATDIAVLELEQAVRDRPYRTAAAPPHRGQAFWTKGFPAGQDGGMDAAGMLGTPIEFGRVLAQGNELPGFFIEGGFSGAPVLDEATGAVLGMAAEATRDQAKRTAFVIPAEQLEFAWPPLAQPYKGLNGFREADSRFFHGRRVYIDELAHKVAQLPFVAVVGRSGSGKSSLVYAGLIPHLKETGDWTILSLRPGAPSTEPFRNLATCLLDAARGHTGRLGTLLSEADVADLARALWDNPAIILEYLRRLPAGNPSAQLLLVVDQFEELFTLVPDPAEEDPRRSVRARFVQCLQAAADTTNTREPAARCIITLRVDYMGRALGLRELADLLRDSDIKLGPMNVAEVRAAIEEPARSLGVAFEDGLVDELIQSVSGAPDALPLLEFTLADLWGKQRNKTICRPDLPAGETVSDVLVATLTRHADAVFAELSRQFGEATFRSAISSLVWLGDPNQEGKDTRRVRRRSEFTEAGENGVCAWALLEQLASQDRQARLVTTGASRTDGEPTVEIVHEALIRSWERLRQWLDEDRLFLLWLQKTEAEAAEWRKSQDTSDLLQGRKLTEAERWWEERAAEDIRPVADYLVVSLQHRRTQADQEEARRRALTEQRIALKRTRKFLTITGGVAIVTMISSFLAIYQFQEANMRAKEAQVERELAERYKGIAEQYAREAQMKRIACQGGKAETP